MMTYYMMAGCLFGSTCTAGSRRDLCVEVGAGVAGAADDAAAAVALSGARARAVEGARRVALARDAFLRAPWLVMVLLTMEFNFSSFVTFMGY